MIKTWLTLSTTIERYDIYGIGLFIMIWSINLVLLGLLYLFVIKPIIYKTKYSPIQVEDAVISDKWIDTKVHTTYVHTGKTMVPIVTTTKHYYLDIKGIEINKVVDSKKWYMEFNSSQIIEVHYNKEYRTFRFSYEDNWEYVRDNIVDLFPKNKNNRGN